MRKSPDLRMETAIFGVLLFTVSWTHCVQSQLPLDTDFDCQRDAPSLELNLTAMAGYWYEAARAPNVDGMICLNVSVPAALDDETKDLKIQLEYIDTLGKKAKAVKETFAFPWNEETANGTFVVELSSSSVNIPVIYKMLIVHPEAMIILCGYTGISAIPLFKLLTRQRQLYPITVNIIKELLSQAGLAGNIIWTEQSPDRCNAAVRSATEAIAILALAIVWLLFRWN